MATNKGPDNAQPVSPPKKRKEPPQSSRTTDAPSRNRKPSTSQAGESRPKRARHAHAREIATQKADAALNDAGELNLQAFLNAREFEIRSLEESMRLSRGAATSRAFQHVPRGMRRRTASHNVKRVPKRLQARARREQIEDNTPTVTARRRSPRTTRARIRAETAKKLGLLVERKRRKLKKAEMEAKAKGGVDVEMDRSAKSKGKITIQTRPARPKIRRNELNAPPKPNSKFRKRQVNKTWLPTHLWHAKRARMTEPKNPLWRFAIPLSPNEKVYRATHRASGERGTLAWDTSYMSTIGLYGSEIGIERVLRLLDITQESYWDDRGLRWRTGVRHWSGWLYKTRSSSKRPICPATIVWNPLSTSQDGRSEADGQEAKKAKREVFIRMHPSAFLETFNELLVLCRMQNPRLYIEDLRFEIGSLELRGPASTEALLGILQPYHNGSEAKEQHASMFESLNGVTNPGSLPTNVILAFSIKDPRLKYPPQTVSPPDRGDSSVELERLQLLADWPASKNLAPFDLFDRNARLAAAGLPTQKSLNRRRSMGPPGTYLDISASDPPIPILLAASWTPGNTRVQGSWTLLAPWKCILPIWHCLMRYPLWSGGNPRFVGLDEYRQAVFENGQPCFPHDFVGTDAGAKWELEERARRRADWEKRPKAKRVEWSSLDLGAGRRGELGVGWSCDFENLFDEAGASASSDGEPTDDPMDVDTKKTTNKSTIAEAAGKADFLQKLQYVPKAVFLRSQDPNVNLDMPPHGIIHVAITFLYGGVATACARIYSLPLPPSSSATIEVPSTEPPIGSSSMAASLPKDLREQWLRRSDHTKKSNNKTSNSRPNRHTTTVDLQERKRALAQTLVSSGSDVLPPLGAAGVPMPQKPNQMDMCGHPLVPGAECLMGFVTTGSYCLKVGKATAIGTLHAAKALQATQATISTKEQHLCIVRNAGESIGWLAKWDLV